METKLGGADLVVRELSASTIRGERDLPRKNYRSLKRLSLGNLVLALEADLDSIQLQLQPRYASKLPFPRDIQKVRGQVQRCLAVARILQSRFPQDDYTLNRCQYGGGIGKPHDELPGHPMGEAKKDWYKYKREQHLKKVTLLQIAETPT